MTLENIYFIGQTIDSPGGRAWWRIFCSTMHLEFVAHMDAVLINVPISRVVTKDQWIEALNALGDPTKSESLQS